MKLQQKFDFCLLFGLNLSSTRKKCMNDKLKKIEVKVQGKKVILKSDITVEIPVMQILWVKFDESPGGILIETASGIDIRFEVEPNERQKTKDIIQREWLKFFKQRHGLKSDG